MDASGDLVVTPTRGLPGGLIIPAAELVERFSRSSGPGGQSVNTTDSRVELSWDVAASTALTDAQRAALLADPRVTRLASSAADEPGGAGLVVRASEQRSQLRNRVAARGRLRNLIVEAFAPAPPDRRATRPSRAARARRVENKRRHGQLKSGRRQPPLD